MKGNYSKELQNATGEIRYNMTNDYMFRYVLQKNKKVLKGLICSILHLEVEDVKSVEIQNPINMSEDITGKEFILDIQVLLNDNTLINLEMQVNNNYDWTERTLSYLCRNYDQLYRGQKYKEVMPVYHIGFLDFSLYPEQQEFYATYRMLNVKNHQLYSDKLTIGVIDLSRIELATEEDKAYKIDYWARLFKAKTWEDLKMLAQNNEYLEEAAESIYKANADDILMQKCRAREEVERRERTYQRDMKLLQEVKVELEEEIKGLLQDKEELLQDKESLLKRIEELEKQLGKSK